MKVTEGLEEVIPSLEQERTREIRKKLSELLTSESGTVESLYELRQLMEMEDNLRKTKDSLLQWPLAINIICEFVENSLDKFYYDIDYELRDNYSFWIIINSEKCLCIELDRCGSREMIVAGSVDYVIASSCKFKWGIVDRRRSKFYVDRFTVNNTSTVGDHNSIERMLETVSNECKNIKIGGE